MAIYHVSAQIVQRSTGRNAVAAAAYRSASNLTLSNPYSAFYSVDAEGNSFNHLDVYSVIDNDVHNELNQLINHGTEVEHTYNYSQKKGVVYSAIHAPENASEWMYDREKLWNAVEARETRKNSQIAREFDIALPVELTQEENIELIREFTDKVLVAQGMIADLNVHYDNEKNPHCHIMTTMRNINNQENGEAFFDKKVREWNETKFLLKVREQWAVHANHYLEMHGHETRISHLSHAERGIELQPTMHIGPAGKQIKDSDRKRINNNIIWENARAIRENPELIIDRVSVNRPVFSKEDLAVELSKELTVDVELVDEYKNIIGANNIKKNNVNSHKATGEELNKVLGQEFMNLYSRVLSSDKMTLIVEEDLKGRSLFATTKRVDLESRSVTAIEELSKSSNHNLEKKETDLSERAIEAFSVEQKKVVLNILNGKDISVLEGLPGVGKTFVMKEVVEQYRQAGYSIIGTAVSSNAALHLGAETGIEAANISLLRKMWHHSDDRSFKPHLNSDYFNDKRYDRLENCPLTDKHVLIVDESSMVDLANSDYLTSMVAKSGCKLIMLGDSNQFGAIGMRGAFTKAGKIAGVSRLSEVRRQNDLEHARATELLSEYRIKEALEIYKADDSIKLFNSDKATIEGLVKDYTHRYIEVNGKNKYDISMDTEPNLANGASFKTLAVCAHTNESVNIFNKAVRGNLKEAGIIKGDDYSVLTGKKKLEVGFGEQIVFTRNDGKLGVLNGELGKIVKIVPLKDGHAIMKTVVNKADGSSRIVSINTMHYKEDRGELFNYGYALTAYKLQGATVDEVYMHCEEKIGYEAFNVMATRHRDKLSIYANKGALEENIYGNHKSGNNSIDVEQTRLAYSEKFSQELWFGGLVKQVSKRVNSSFAIDYKEMGLSNEDQVLKSYIESSKFVIDHLSAAHLWQEKEEKRSGVKPEIFKYNEWSALTEHKKNRDEIAKEIVKDSSKYMERMIQSDISYEKIVEHSKEGLHNVIIKAQKEEGHSIAELREYRAIVNQLEQMRESWNEFSSKTSNKNYTILSPMNELAGNYKKLKTVIKEYEVSTAECREELKTLQNHRQEREEKYYYNTQYIEKFFPEYLSQTFNESPKVVIAKWNNLVSQKGKEAALASVKKTPTLLGTLQGKGLGQWLTLNESRAYAVANVKNLNDRLEKYNFNTEREVQLKLDLIEVQKSHSELKEKELISSILLLEQVIPNKLEEQMMKTVKSIINHSKTHSNDFGSNDYSNNNKLEKLLQSEVINEVILEKYNREHKHNLNVTGTKIGNKDEGIEINEKVISSKTNVGQNLATAGKITDIDRDVDRNIAKNSKVASRKFVQVQYKDVNNALSNYHFEEMFRQYAHRINNDGVIRRQGSNITCGSLTMDLKSGLWTRFSTNDGGDIYQFVSHATGANKIDALNTVAEIAGVAASEININRSNANYSNKDTKETAHSVASQRVTTDEVVNEWIPYGIVPKNAMALNVEKDLSYLSKKNSIENVFTYRNQAGEIIGHTVRCVDRETGKKAVMPVAYCHNEALSKDQWRLKGFTDEKAVSKELDVSTSTNLETKNIIQTEQTIEQYKPIYGIQKLAGSSKTVLIVEGEKTADAAQKMLPEYDVISWLGGSAAAGKADWSKLSGKEVAIWPDNDQAGFKAAKIIKSTLQESKIQSVEIIEPSSINNTHDIIDNAISESDLNKKQQQLPAGWDLADELPHGVSSIEVKKAIANSMGYHEGVNDFVKHEDHASKINDIRKLDSKFNLKEFKEELAFLNSDNKEQALYDAWLDSYRECVMPKVKAIIKEGQKAQSINEYIKVMEKDKAFCADIYDNFKSLNYAYRIKEDDAYITATHVSYYKQPNLIKNFLKHANDCVEFGIMSENNLLSEVKGAGDSSLFDARLVDSCEKFIAKDIDRNLQLIDQGQKIIHENIEFKDRNSFLEYKSYDRRIKESLQEKHKVQTSERTQIVEEAHNLIHLKDQKNTINKLDHLIQIDPALCKAVEERGDVRSSTNTNNEVNHNKQLIEQKIVEHYLELKLLDSAKVLSVEEITHNVVDRAIHEENSYKKWYFIAELILNQKRDNIREVEQKSEIAQSVDKTTILAKKESASKSTAIATKSLSALEQIENHELAEKMCKMDGYLYTKGVTGKEAVIAVVSEFNKEREGKVQELLQYNQGVVALSKTDEKAARYLANAILDRENNYGKINDNNINNISREDTSLSDSSKNSKLMDAMTHVAIEQSKYMNSMANHIDKQMEEYNKLNIPSADMSKIAEHAAGSFGQEAMTKALAHNNELHGEHTKDMTHNHIDHHPANANILQSHIDHHDDRHMKDSHHHIDHHISRYLGCVKTLQQDHSCEIEQHKENEINRQKEIERNMSHSFSINM